MANALYDKARESFLGQNPALDWDTDTIKCVMVNVTGGGTLYTVNLATHQFISDVAAAARLTAFSSAFASKTVAAGVADAADIVFALQSGAEPCEAIVIFKDTGTEGTSPLIAYIDTATGLPITFNGADVTIVWDNGANKIFKL